MKKWFLMLLTAGITLYFIIMYEAPEMYRLLAMELMWFGAALLQLWYGKQKVQIHLLDYARVVDKGTEIPLQISLENKGPFPVPFMTIYLKTGQNSSFTKMTCSLKGHEKRCEMVSVKAETAGLRQFELSKMLCYDWLHLFSGGKKLKQRISVLVLPEIYPVAMEIQASFRYFGDESGLYYEDDEGNDPTEVLDIRPYQAGDRFQKIHWKLSQRTGDLMVREYSEPIGFAVVFLLDTDVFSEAYIETFMSISMQMCEEKCLHYICYMDGNGVLVRKAIIHIESIYLFLQMVAGKNQKDQKSKPLDEDIYNDWYGRESYHTSLRLTKNLELYKQGELSGRIAAQDVKGSLAQLMLEI